MKKEEMRRLFLSKVEEMVTAYNEGDVLQSQKCYEYLLGFCESCNIDFTCSLQDAIKILKSKCVGVLDTAKYDNYTKGTPLCL